jgi:ATP-dependent RNA helicase RhlE
MLFSELGLAAPLLRALEAQGYVTPTPVQAQAIPPALEGRDVLGSAQTGTGKTAAFALPLLHRLFEAGPLAVESPWKQADEERNAAARRHPPRVRPGHRRPGGRAPRGPQFQEPYRPTRVLVLAPTRELAVQIAESTHDYGAHTGLTLTAIYGGVGYPRQFEALGRGVDIVVATPGRLVDLMQQGYVDFSHLTAFVLDEADRMLDMGFLPDLKKIIQQLPAQKQTLFFSATMPPEIARLADELLHDPVRIAITPERPAAERIEQSVCFVSPKGKSPLLIHWMQTHSVGQAIVFTKTKHGADRVAKHMNDAKISAEAIHGNKSQNARQRTLQAFKNGGIQVLVATDLAARGIDVDGISHVFNYDLPREPETYVHRIGRTARAGAEGIAVSFCAADERGLLRGIERLLGTRLAVDSSVPEEWRVEAAPNRSADYPASGGRAGGQRRPAGNGVPVHESQYQRRARANAATRSGQSHGGGGQASNGQAAGTQSKSRRPVSGPPGHPPAARTDRNGDAGVAVATPPQGQRRFPPKKLNRPPRRPTP